MFKIKSFLHLWPIKIIFNSNKEYLIKTKKKWKIRQQEGHLLKLLEWGLPLFLA